MKTSGFIHRQTIPFLPERFRKLFPKAKPDGLKQLITSARTVKVEDITYWSDGLNVKGFLVYPKKPGKYPCIIYNRGGNEEFGKLDVVKAYRILARLAAAGYVVIASQYRGNAGGEGKEEIGGKDLHDVSNLIPCLRQVKSANTRKIGMFGWSRGGMMTLVALKKLRNIRAAVIGGAPTDIFRENKRRPKMAAVYRRLIPYTGKRYQQELRKRSAVYWPEQIAPRTPLLIMHGQSDWRVHPDNSWRLAKRLIKLNRPVRLKIYEGSDHGIFEQWPNVMMETIDWFDRFLKRGEKLPNTKPHGP